MITASRARQARLFTPCCVRWCRRPATVTTLYNGRQEPVWCEYHEAYFDALPSDKELRKASLTVDIAGLDEYMARWREARR